MFLSATVRLTSNKSCFVSLSVDLIQRLPPATKSPGKVVVFQVEWAGGLAFISWSGETAVNRSVGFGQTQLTVIEVGKKFADLNGIKMGEQVVLTPLDSIPSCTRIHVDPLSADDWEILELHAGFIESNLLNQVRVVWSGQVVPVWINKTACIAIRIGELEPVATCVVLEEFTEVVIAPKQRQFGSSKQQNLTSTKQQTNPQPKETTKPSSPVGTTSDTKRVEENAFSSSLYNIWNYLFTRQEQTTEEISELEPQTVNQSEVNGSLNDTKVSSERNCCKSTFADREMDLCLRSQLDFQNSSGNLDGTEDMCSRQLSCVFVNPESLGLRVLKCGKRHRTLCPDDFDGLCKIVTIRKLLSPKEKLELLNIDKGKNSKGTEVTQDNPRKKSEILLKPVTIRMVLRTNVLPGHIVLRPLLQNQLGAGGISRFRVSDTKQRSQELQGIILHPVVDVKTRETSSQDIISSFYIWIATSTSEEYPLIIWNGVMVAFDCCGNSLDFIITVLSHAEDAKDSESTPYYDITPSLLDGIKVVLGDERSLPKTAALLWQMQSENTVQLTCGIKDLGGFAQPFDKCLNHLLVSLEKIPLSSYLSGGLTKGLGNGAVLICGSGLHAGEGCGKTSLGHALCHELQQWPIGAHVIVIDCIPLRGKRVETIQRQWQQAFLEADWYQPSVILLDNLDHVISAPSLAQEMGGEGLYRLRLVQVFKDLVTTAVVNKSKVAVIATSRSRDCLHGALQSGHGLHVFQCCVELSTLNERQRLEVLSKLIVKKFHDINQTELETLAKSVARRCEGFSPKDLSAVVDRALHFAVVRQMKCHKKSTVTLALEDFNQALSGYSPASLRGVQLHKPGHLTWLDVGGLEQVKKALQETLLWPTKYAALFAKCPLRLRSGLLLYGPPGTGKTLLAGVIAKESGLNFISIKGPELLSKYIGASEQAVRDVFSRAQTARPCILFFDEFDALAPRRGHDSTGVTDRVVNQLLTQLDGVEGLEGVYILAATSRPGLIDPALLRPGRLDKCIYCPIPSKTERLEILQALTRSISLADDVDLKSIAECCEHFTGADLKALLYDAQLESIHRKTSKFKLYGNIFGKTDDVEGLTKAESVNQESSKQESVKEGNIISICQSDLEKAATSMRPSVSPNERLAYENIFDSFMGSRGSSFTKNSPVKGKVTLA